MLPGRKLNKRVEPCNHPRFRWCTHTQVTQLPTNHLQLLPAQSKGRESPYREHWGASSPCRALQWMQSSPDSISSRDGGKGVGDFERATACLEASPGILLCWQQSCLCRQASRLPHRGFGSTPYTPLPCGYSSLTSPVSVILEWHHRELVS